MATSEDLRRIALYAAILVRLPAIDVGTLEMIVRTAWRLRATKSLLAKADEEAT
jgi:hypothetical protein